MFVLDLFMQLQTDRKFEIVTEINPKKRGRLAKKQAYVNFTSLRPSIHVLKLREMEDVQRVSGESRFYHMAHAVESKSVGVIVHGGWMILTTWGNPLSHQRLAPRNAASVAFCRPPRLS